MGCAVDVVPKPPKAPVVPEVAVPKAGAGAAAVLPNRPPPAAGCGAAAPKGLLPNRPPAVDVGWPKAPNPVVVVVAAGWPNAGLAAPKRPPAWVVCWPKPPNAGAAVLAGVPNPEVPNRGFCCCWPNSPPEKRDCKIEL